MNIRCFTIVIFAVIQIFFTPLFAYEMHLINGNLRLAATGNLDLIIEDYNNEINGYDFGESPAGIIDDDNGKSQVYIPGMYGYKKSTNDSLDDRRHGYGFSLKSIFKMRSRFAIGNSFSKTNAVLEYSPDRRSTSNNYYDSIFIGYKINSIFNIGFRGSYYKETRKDEYLYVENDERDAYSYESSFMISPIKSDWQFGLNYRLRKYWPYFTTHKFLIPIIYSSTNLRCGLKLHLTTRPHDSPERAFEIRSTYLIPISQNHLKIGFLLKGIAPYADDEYSYIWTSGCALNIGSGLAYLDEDIGLIGMQYKIIFYKVNPISLIDGNSQTVQDIYFNIGAELYLIKNIPLRLGYVIAGMDYYNFTYNFVTSGFGIRIPNSKFGIDFVYNVKFIKYSGFEGETITEADNHIFGLSGRYIF